LNLQRQKIKLMERERSNYESYNYVMSIYTFRVRSCLLTKWFVVLTRLVTFVLIIVGIRAYVNR
jgi:hypothetical protein